MNNVQRMGHVPPREIRLHFYADAGKEMLLGTLSLGSPKPAPSMPLFHVYTATRYAVEKSVGAITQLRSAAMRGLSNMHSVFVRCQRNDIGFANASFEPLLFVLPAQNGGARQVWVEAFDLTRGIQGESLGMCGFSNH